MKRVITFGAFDLLNEGQLGLLQQAREEGDYLIVGISSDANRSADHKAYSFSQSHRMARVAALKYVDEVFLYESTDLKAQYVRDHNAALVVAGEDCKGQLDDLGCEVKYTNHFQDLEPSTVATQAQSGRCLTALFGDTYLDKHMDCALTIVNAMLERNVAPILTKQNSLPRHITTDALVYFNKPINAPFQEYSQKKRVLIDHGASHLKWFLGSRERFDFFDVILSAGPDHVRALEAIFGKMGKLNKVRPVGFVKSEELMAPPRMSREELAAHAGVDATRPIILFAPTWHISANEDMVQAIEELKKVDNHVASFHPETAHLPVTEVNTVRNINGMTLELIKHADVVISDLSSTIYEAAALGKPVVQLLLKEYPDNTALLFDLPLSAGTAEHFCGGLICRPQALVETIARALSNDPDVKASMEACHKRILAGTYISNEATDAVADHIRQICAEAAFPEDEKTEAEAEVASPPRYSRNMFYAQNRLIAHAGGNYKGHHASNSREAIKAGLNACNIVELDFCLSSDGVIVAHDTFEKKYKLKGSFSETDTGTFEATRFEKTLHPISLADAIRECTRNNKALVCDIKPTKEAYKQVAKAIRDAVSAHGQIEQTVIQCYCVDDFKVAMELGFQRAMLPAWKYYYLAPMGEDVFDFYARCIEINADAVWGLSLPWQNKHMPYPVIDYPNYDRMRAFWKRIFVHGAPMHEYSRILKMNAGLFADAFSDKYEFAALDHDFDWRKYLFLNKDLLKAGHDDEIKAILHYLRYGIKEGRITSYDLPKDFNYMNYINRNPKLRKSSINAYNTAAAHYTRYGAKEGLLY